jgi:hypothetical protein
MYAGKTKEEFKQSVRQYGMHDSLSAREILRVVEELGIYPDPEGDRDHYLVLETLSEVDHYGGLETGISELSETITKALKTRDGIHLFQVYHLSKGTVIEVMKTQDDWYWVCLNFKHPIWNPMNWDVINGSYWKCDQIPGVISLIRDHRGNPKYRMNPPPSEGNLDEDED